MKENYTKKHTKRGRQTWKWKICGKCLVIKQSPERNQQHPERN